MLLFKDYQYDMSETAKILNIKIGRYLMGKNILYEHLRLLNILEYRGKNNYPKEEFFQAGFFKQVFVIIKNQKPYPKTYVTCKGIQWLKQTQLRKIIEAEIQYWKDHYPKYLYLLKE